MRVAIIGGSGLLGQYLVREWSGDQIKSFGSKDLNIRDTQQVAHNIRSFRADWIILTAAYTDVDGCESNPELAFAVNAGGAAHVAEAAKQYGARLLFLSTDYVFDGMQSKPYEVGDPCNPQSVYGHSKAKGELEILRILPESCIVRTAWVFGTTGRCFPETILRLAESRQTIDVVDDQRGAPTYARDLARGIIDLCRKNAGGMVHMTNSGECSWFEFASEIVRRSGLSPVVRPTATEKFPRPAKRPAYSVLSLASLKQYGIEMPSWQTALSEYLEERRKTVT